MTGHLSTTTMFRPEARCHGPMAVSTGQEESRWFSIVTVVRFQRVSALAGAARLTVTVSARATAMKARRMRSEERRVGKECRSRWWENHTRERYEERTEQTR